MLTLTRSTPADHESVERLTFEELLSITRLTGRPANAPRPVIVVVDDVLNSGKHFKVAQSLIQANFPEAAIRGVFLSRCVRQFAELET
jgi:hypoxanthine phosphoribosyltransferase